MATHEGKGPKPFLGEDFLLETETARRLYHEHAAKMPIFDYHCHIPPAELAENKRFENLTKIWLAGDHYKWRAMRANGIPERRITGDADDRDKFHAWAETVPYTIGNPLYHWTHLELEKPFGVKGKLLDRTTADEIYDRCNTLLETESYRVRGILKYFRVKAVCTTDDPADDLAPHAAMRKDDSFETRVFPAFRPDKAHKIENPESFNAWHARLEKAVGSSIPDYDAFLQAVKERHDYFHAAGSRLSDHGIDFPVAEEYTHADLAGIYKKVRSGKVPDESEVMKFRSAMLFELGKMDAKSGWTMQLHIGAIRNVNTKMYKALGPDTGFDSSGDFAIASALGRFLDRLAASDALPKMILYSVNPNDNEVLASMIGNFQDGSVPGKMQFGSAWWFNDQKDGMLQQMTTLAYHGLLSRFVGMLTDSRSFLSYPRHEYFRRILCNLIGRWVEDGEAPNDVGLLGTMVENISYNNALSYFGLDVK